MVDKSSHTNLSGMGHIYLSFITEGYKEFAVGGVRSDKTLIHSDQTSATIYRRGHVNKKISLGSLKTCTEIRRVRFGRNINYGNGVDPPRTIGIIIPQVTRQGIFNVFDSIRGTSYLSERSAS